MAVTNAGGKLLRQYPFVAWERLKPSILWRQGQHVFSCGGTGSGKSTVAGEFFPRRSQVVVCVSKGMDEIFEGPYYSDYVTHGRWNPGRRYKLGREFGKAPDRILLRPGNARDIVGTRAVKKAIFQRMFDDVLLHRGKWCVGIDEEHYMCSALGLEREITDMLEQGRSALISMWNNTQRPSDIPLATYVNSSHGFLFSSQEEYDVKRLGRMRNKHTTAPEMMYNIERLDSFDTHEFVYLDRTGKIPPVRSIVSRKRMVKNAD
jgi:hypothetical protein